MSLPRFLADLAGTMRKVLRISDCALDATALTAPRNQLLQDKPGVIALRSDPPIVANVQPIFGAVAADTVLQLVTLILDGVTGVVTEVEVGGYNFNDPAGGSVAGLVGGFDGRVAVLSVDPDAADGLTIKNDDASVPDGQRIRTPAGADHVIPPGGSVTLRWIAALEYFVFDSSVPAAGAGGAVDSVNGQTGVVVLDAADVGAGVPLYPRRDDITAASGDIRFLLDKTPWQGYVDIYDDDRRLMLLSDLTGTGRQRYLASGATGGEVYTVSYWTDAAAPGATIMDDATALAWAPVYPAGEIDTPYDYTPAPATGGTPPYSYAHVSGTLPPGLSFDTTDGQLSGTPTNLGGSPYTFRVEATDAMAGVVGADQSMAINVASDPFFANVVSLLHFDSVVTADEIPARTWTVTDSATVSTTEKKFGAGGAYPITGMKADDSSDWAFGTGDYTIELWVKFQYDPTGTIHGLIANYEAGGGGGGYAGFGILFNSNQISYYSGLGANQIANLPWAPTDGVWYHVAVCRGSGSLRAFIDGTQIGSTVSDSTNVVVTRGPWLGRFSTLYGFNFGGALDDVRVTKGIARYTANFTPPTATFPNA